jgi:F0F1-type ATP synthase assembly protein I
VKTANLKEMIKDSAPKVTPKPSGGEVSKEKKDDRLVFFSAVLDMTWQLALVFLIPIIGGYELDEHLKTSPLWLIVGGVLALAGVFAVLRRILNQLNQSFTHPGSKDK